MTGRYEGHIDTRWLPGTRAMLLLSQVAFIEPNGSVWKCAPGDVVDGASVPKYLQWLFGHPFHPDHRDASVIHDVACNKLDPRGSVAAARAFYFALRTSGMGHIRAWLRWAGVRYCGPQWGPR